MEKRGKKSKLEAYRTAYHMACWHANFVIMDRIALTFETTSAIVLRLLVSDGTLLRDCFTLRPPVSCSQTATAKLCARGLHCFFIRRWLISNQTYGRIYDPLTFDHRYSWVPLADIQPVDNDEVRHLLASMPAKLSPMDKVPTSILKSCTTCSAVFSPIIDVLQICRSQKLLYRCRSSWHASHDYSRNQVSHMMKQATTDQFQSIGASPFSAYGPTHLCVSKLQPSLIHLSTSSFNGNGANKNPKWDIPLPVLRFKERYTSGSAWYIASDTLDIPTIEHWLKYSFGVTGITLRRIKSYLSNWAQFVKVSNAQSFPEKCSFEVHQGSVLRPLLFTLYFTPLANVIASFGVEFHRYADDIQAKWYDG